MTFYCILIIMLFEALLLIILIKYKIKAKTLQIKYFSLNILFILIYISIFIILILNLRYAKIGETYDLLKTYAYVLDHWNASSFFIKVLLILTLLNLILLLIKIKKFLEIQYCKRYLYQYYKIRESEIDTGKKAKILIIIKILRNKMSYSNLIFKIEHLILNLLNTNFLKNINEIYLLKMLKLLMFFFRNLPIIILIGFFIYDCIFNSFKIQLILFYLPFFFTFQLWKNITNFLKKTDDTYNSIIYEMYYKQDDVKYLNISLEEENILQKYITSNLHGLQHDIKLDAWENYYKQIINFPFDFIKFRRFGRQPNTNIFFNKYLKKYDK